MPLKTKFIRKAKAERRNLKFWADGVRETEILLPRLPEYMDALAQGWRAERACLDSICNEFHARIPWTVGDNEEPEELLPYDKYAPVVEEDLTDEQRKAKFARIQLLNARIQRWLKYRARRMTNKFSRANLSLDSPFTRLFYRMRCIKRPLKARSLVQQFLYEEKERLVAPEVARILAARNLAGGADDDGEENGKKKKTIDINERTNVARTLMEKMFNEDPTGTLKAGYDQRRRAESASAVDAWTHLKTVGYPTDADWRDRAISEIRDFITEVFKEIHAMTGLRIFSLMGGPVSGLPENDPFATIAISVGKNNAPRPVGFTKFDSKRYNDDLIPFFKQYLKTCFTAEDIRKAQKPEHGGPAAGTSIDPGAGFVDVLKAAKYVLDDEDEDDEGYQTDNSITSVSDVFSDDDTVSTRQKGKGKAKAKAVAKKKIPVTLPRTRAAAAASPTPGSINEAAAAKQKAEEEAAAKEKAIQEAAAKKAEAQERAMARQKEAAKAEGAALVAYARSDEGKAEAARLQAQKRARLEEEESRRRERFARAGTITGSVFGDAQSLGSASRGASPISDVMEIDDQSVVFNPDDGEASGRDDPPPTTDDDDQPTDVDMASAPEDPESEGLDDVGGSRGKKRRRLSSSASDTWHPFSVEIPEKAPNWLVRTAKELSKADLGEHYRTAVTALVELETLYEFQDTGRKLPTTGRPPQLAAWFKNDRKWADKPAIRIKSLADYETQWKQWWATLEPPWRKSSDDGELGVSGRVWNGIQAPGKLGMLQAVVGLNCWGRELALQKLPSSSGYEEATADVLWALMELKRDASTAAARLRERPKPKPAAGRGRGRRTGG
ncbi:hypothetical protein C8F01DRAFT_1266149 [Mycena amicta]|nr:hypothetical protein C8F01DRAFT_1266149 [Mycena amicta]